MAREDLNFERYKRNLAESGAMGFVERMRFDGADQGEALTETAFEVADETIAFELGASGCLAVIGRSPNYPEEWRSFVEDDSEWHEVIEAMAFSVARQDFYDAMQDHGFLDDSREPTSKLLAMVEA